MTIPNCINPKLKIPMKKRFILSLLLSLLAASSALAQFSDDLKILSVDALISQDKVIPGTEFDVAVVLQIEPGLHINANQPSEEFLIPTIVKLDPQPDMSFGRVLYPQPEMKTFAFSDNKLAVYEGKTMFYLTVSTSPQIPLGEKTITGTVSFQGCNESTCFAPAEKKFTAIIEIVPSGTPVAKQHAEIFALAPKSGEQAPDISQTLSADELRARQIIEKGLAWAMIAFFGIGLALNLTPCVYPVIPLTVSYFGSQSGQTKSATFFSALIYVIGIAISFAILGLISGLAGKQWGFLFASPWFVLAITTIILVMAASMFGAFEITVPNWLMNKFGTAKQGIIGSLIMGLTVGVIIAPCAAGIIIGLVGLVAKLGLVAKGGLLFFIMGLGLGLPYLFLATFSGFMNRLPQSGMWMVWIKKLFGLLLVGVAIYFLIPQLEHIYDKLSFFLGLLGVFGGLLLGFLDQFAGYTRSFKIVRVVIGILFIALGIRWTSAAIHSKPSEIDWIHYQGQATEQLLLEGKPAFIDFYADWCAPCKQLDRETFRDPAVVEMAKSWTMIKVDCTSPDQATREFMNRFTVAGMPTLVFIDKSGKEVPELREIGFIGVREFVERMKRVIRGH